MGATIILTQHAKDFAQWKKVFDENVGLRIRGGCLSTTIYRDPSDPTRIVVINEMKDVAAARRYIKMPELVNAMFHATVIGAPSIVIVEQVDHQSYPPPAPAEPADGT